MRTWQDIFAEKIAELHLLEPWTLQEDDTLQVQVLGPDWKEFVQHRAPGRFQCSQCFHVWSSAKVHILFHMCRCQGWGVVWMRIFRQKCTHCPNPQLENPDFSLETVETILHNLVVKILQYFYNKPVQPCDLLEVVVDTPVAGPHNSAHCEACQHGICNKSRPALASGAWKPLTDVDKARTHRIKSQPALGVDIKKLLRDVGKAKTHRTQSQPARAGFAWKPLTDEDDTLKRQGLTAHATSTHGPSPCNSNFPLKRCCCISSILLCVLAVIVFLVLYFTIM
ncbi:PREDICTED: receptor-transporting protein 3-like [Acanthisitta chloris]|uniref:receptor-transporting protein 3-like n=1 Tax=Acanthisitta chloris TaxID=57068 RepID=UPI0004F0C9D0|nr:PREDICTED: receptor-transporting protein 3-like [Acanthisitta chloris]